MILAIETASAEGAVALLDGAQVLSETALSGGRQQHAAQLLLAIDALLERHGAALDEVEGIALSVGPGSFTGLRIGLSTALGLCFGSERWIVPVPTLAALSLRAGEEGAGAGDADAIVPMLDARKGELYTALYGPGAALRRPDCVVAAAPWLESLGDGDFCLVGPGTEVCAREIERVLGARARIVGGAAGRPSAAQVGLLGARLASEGRTCAPRQVDLQYVRAPDAASKQPAGQPGARHVI
ncbi:MAG: tRNA (adenosine(37)-N6)-threonylcarbamoyltransferase complex dimerization subunit type 1 TsaB [Deltaproteobacteria bacterium]|nr:tRNA (adenosine(37)-N6)-threonylcarbamoyltransferase complex dimerization subunit type 1 TsaB [Deltaproteobacteria bacterium]MBW2415872.1 tRNA (adenosine(37)-N6)-threonylcarbamoyltransferase complex dimerization subunit type 1 TsaB [Deltaproteobacteria bacterium]